MSGGPSDKYTNEVNAFLSAPATVPWQPGMNDPLAALPPPPPPAAPTKWGPDPLQGRVGPAPNPIEQGVALAQARGDLPVSAAPAPAANVNAAPAPAANPNEYHLQRVAGSGRMIGAREMDMRGPSLKAAQGRANDAFGGAALANAANTQANAQAEADMYAQQERQARLREEAAMQSVAQRDEELYQRQQDFDQSVRALSKMQLDPNRFWATRSTGQRIGAMVSIALGGFLQGARGGSNPGLDIINTQIERDIKAQEFGFFAARDTAHAKQTAFSMAMQKYQNVDAARAMARAAALDGVQAQVSQMGALWKDTQAANHANSMMAALEEQKMNQIAQGVKFLPPTMAARQYVDPKTGLIYNESEAKALAKEMRDHEFKREEIGLNTAGDIRKEEAKAGVQQQSKIGEETRFIAEKVQAAGIPQARALAEQALAALRRSPGGASDAAARGALGETLSSKVLSDDANAREQAYNAYKNAAMKALMGNVTAGEEARADKQFGLASDPASRIRSIESTLSMLDDAERNIVAGTSPSAQSTYRKQVETAKAGKDLTPKDTTEGWSSK